jgi:hypothetical protein
VRRRVDADETNRVEADETNAREADDDDIDDETEDDDSRSKRRKIDTENDHTSDEVQNGV